MRQRYTDIGHAIRMIQCKEMAHSNLEAEMAQVIEADLEQIDRLTAALKKFVDHFGPLEDNHMLHEEARVCFRLAREALGAAEHDRLIRSSLQQS